MANEESIHFLSTGNQQQRLPSVRASPNGGSAILIVECHMKNIFPLLFQNIWMHYVFHPFKAIFALNHNFVFQVTSYVVLDLTPNQEYTYQVRYLESGIGFY